VGPPSGLHLTSLFSRGDAFTSLIESAGNSAWPKKPAYRVLRRFRRLRLQNGNQTNEKRYGISRVGSTAIFRAHAEAVDDKAAGNHGYAAANQVAASLIRLEKLAEAIFSKAAKGNLVAVRLAIEIEKRRAQLIELDERGRQAASESGRLEEEFRPRQEPDSDLRGSSAEDPGWRARHFIADPENQVNWEHSQVLNCAFVVQSANPKPMGQVIASRCGPRGSDVFDF